MYKSRNTNFKLGLPVVRTATYGPGIDQSQHAKSVSHIIVKLIFHSQKPTLSGSRRVARIFRGGGGGGGVR